MSRCDNCEHRECTGMCVNWQNLKERVNPPLAALVMPPNHSSIPCDMFMDEPPFCICVQNKFDENEDCTHYTPKE